MGMCLTNSTVQQRPHQQNQYPNPASRIQDVDIVKVKLKTARDRINNFLSLKNRDIANIDAKINEKLPSYHQTGDKKQMLPLLKTKKDINTLISNGEVRLRLINDKLAEVELQKINADTIQVLDDSNKYIKEIQKDLQRRDWQGVLEEAKHKYSLQWPDDSQQVENDPRFQALWEEVGGNKIPAKRQVNVVTKPNISQTNQPGRQVQNRPVLIS